jgi:hypothetical protein
LFVCFFHSSNLKYALVGKYTNLIDDGHEKIEIMNPYTDLSTTTTTTITTTSILETSGKAKIDNSGFIHPDHDHTERTYDIMLMKLTRPATNVPSDKIMKINMDPSIPIKEDGGVNEITVIGMGNTDVSGTEPKPDTLQQVHLNYLPYEQCIDSEGYNLDYKFELLPHMICTQGAGIYGNRGQCYGDSGGKFLFVVVVLLLLLPFAVSMLGRFICVLTNNIFFNLLHHHLTGPYIVLGTTPEEDVQVGVVSWAVNCASSVFPMVGSRTSASVDFIRDVTCAVSVDPPEYLCGTTVVTSGGNGVINNVQTRIDVQNGVSVSVRIYSDPYGHELSWKITDQLDTSTIYAEAPYGTIIGDHMFQTIKLPAGSNLRFEINDAADDGIFGDPDAVLYEIVLVDRGDELVMVEGNGQFTTSREENFHVPATSEYQSIFASRYSSFEEAALDRIGSGGPTVPLFIYIEFSDYHEDASWEVTSADGGTVYASKGPNEYRYGNEITEQVNLPSGEYMFTIRDRRGTDDLRAFKSYKISYQDRESLYNSSSGGSTDKLIYESTSLNFIGESASHAFVIESIVSSQPAIVIEDAISLDIVAAAAADGGLPICSTHGNWCGNANDSGKKCCSGICQGARCKGNGDTSRTAATTSNRNRVGNRLSGGNGGAARNGN